MKPRLFTFDIFGTVIDWQTGLKNSLKEIGIQLTPELFDRVIDLQAHDEQRGYKTYREITTASLMKVLSLDFERADKIAANIGNWPLFDDSKVGLLNLMDIAPCAAISNSDRIHGDQVQKQLGYPLSRWYCAEAAQVYKPDPKFWHFVSEQIGIPLGRHWWHVSGYADYDLEVAQSLGLTCIFIPRPHARRGFFHHKVSDLSTLARLALQTP